MLLVGIAILSSFSCDRKNVVGTDTKSRDSIPQDTMPPEPPVSIDTLTVGQVWYVAKGGTGDGSKDNPLGIIQPAINAAALAGGENTVFISSGTFNESLILVAGIHLRGQRDPHNDWEVDNSGTTIIAPNKMGPGHNVGLFAENLHHKTVLENLTIRSGDAYATGGNSIGLYVINSDSLALIRCTVQSGRGGDGTDGSPGTDGADGADGEYTVVDNPGQPGSGGRGGYGGWYCEGTADPPGDGEQGYCVDGSQTGGIGGLGLTDSSSLHNGGVGPAGADGPHGRGGRAGLFITQLGEYPMVATDSGLSGADGGIGCGGGGGGGGGTWGVMTHTNGWECVEPAIGGWGGWGGYPGTRGTGGTGGGSSAAIFATGSSIYLEMTRLITSDGGDGGDGANGGSGGSGGLGEEPGWSIGFLTGPWPGTGGAGGPGGHGGAGGGGAGGHSIGLVLNESSIIYERELRIYPGAYGDGGESPGEDGAHGSSRSRYSF